LASESRKELNGIFKKVYLRTGLAKLPELIQLIDLLLENQVSFVIVVYNSIVMDALKAALSKRQVPFVNISPFFAQSKD